MIIDPDRATRPQDNPQTTDVGFPGMPKEKKDKSNDNAGVVPPGFPTGFPIPTPAQNTATHMPPWWTVGQGVFPGGFQGPASYPTYYPQDVIGRGTYPWSAYANAPMNYPQTTIPQGGVSPYTDVGQGQIPGQRTFMPPGQPHTTPGTPLGNDIPGQVPGVKSPMGPALPDANKQQAVADAAKRAGISPQDLQKFMEDYAKSKGKSLSDADYDPDMLARAAQAAKNSGTRSQDQGVNGPGGTYYGPANMQYPGIGSNEYGGAANRYFQQIAYDINSHRISEPDSYRAAVAAGFTGDYNSWLITKDQIIHNQGMNRERGGGGGVASGTQATPPGGIAPPTTPGGEPNVRPFVNVGGKVQFDESDIGALPTQYRSLVEQLMESLGYTSTGFMGQFGEREFQIVGQPKPVTKDIMDSITKDPSAQAWLYWLAYRKGLSTPTTEAYPGQ